MRTYTRKRGVARIPINAIDRSDAGIPYARRAARKPNRDATILQTIVGGIIHNGARIVVTIVRVPVDLCQLMILLIEYEYTVVPFVACHHEGNRHR